METAAAALTPPSPAEKTRRRRIMETAAAALTPPLFWRQREELTSAFTLDLSECSDITSNGAINPRLGLLKYNNKSTSSEGSRVPN